VKVAYNQRWGEANGNHKLTPDKVASIRQGLTDGVPTRQLARRFGVCQTTICMIKNGLTWPAST